jgi:hypothetical protein
MNEPLMMSAPAHRSTMKEHVLAIDEILNEMMSSEGSISAVGRPTSSREQAVQKEQMRRIIAAGGVRFHCVGCDDTIESKDAAACVCGGFVCTACRRTEEEGVCNHEPPDLPDDM